VASATSGPFSVAASPPVAFIEDPVDGDTFARSEEIVLNATAFDAADGDLPDAALAWSSSRDGALGTGRELALAAGRLSVGQHVLTLTATDSNGLKATDSATITVNPAPTGGGTGSPIVNPSVGSAAPGQAVVLTGSGFPANQIADITLFSTACTQSSSRSEAGPPRHPRSSS
jgi:hypothetical protein